MTVVTGGKGSPRFGCRVSWRQGTCCCPNRLTIMAKVAEPEILRKLQADALEPATLSYITEQVRAALAAHAVVDDGEVVRKQLADERRKRDNLVSAIEQGGENLSVLLAALKGREANIRRLEATSRGWRWVHRPSTWRTCPGGWSGSCRTFTRC
jgi:hypothetical protein